MNEKRILLCVWIAASSATGVATAQSPTPEALTPRRAAELALEHAPALSAARSAVEEGNARASLARDAFHPEAYATTTPGYTYGLPTLVAGRVPSIAGVEIHQTIFDPGRGADLLRAQADEASLTGALERSCRQTLEAALAAYARAWADRLSVDAGRRRVEAAESIVRRSAALSAEGRRTELDVERARLRAARARQALLNAESDSELDELELKRLIGWPASARVVLAEDPSSAVSPTDLAENLVSARAADPELRFLGRQADLLERSVRYESQRYLPVIEASAQYQRLARFNNYDKYYLTFTPDSVAVGVSIAVPLWTGGRTTDSLRSARARLDRARSDIAARESDLEMAVRRSEATLARASAEKSLAARSRGIAEEAMTESRLLAKEGRADANELDERDIALADADDEAAKAGLSALSERARLLALRGELPRAVLGGDLPCSAR